MAYCFQISFESYILDKMTFDKVEYLCLPHCTRCMGRGIVWMAIKSMLPLLKNYLPTKREIIDPVGFSELVMLYVVCKSIQSALYF